MLLDGAKEVFGPFLEILANSVLRLQVSADLEVKSPVPADVLGDVESSIARLNSLNDGRQAMREAGDWFVRNGERLKRLSAAERIVWLALLDDHVRARTRDSGVPISVAEIEALTDAFSLNLTIERNSEASAPGIRRLKI